MRKGFFSDTDQALELSQLVTLERIRRRRPTLGLDLMDQGLSSPEGKRIARALVGDLDVHQLSEQEHRWFDQVRALAGTDQRAAAIDQGTAITG